MLIKGDHDIKINFLESRDYKEILEKTIRWIKKYSGANLVKTLTNCTLYFIAIGVRDQAHYSHLNFFFISTAGGIWRGEPEPRTLEFIIRPLFHSVTLWLWTLRFKYIKFFGHFLPTRRILVIANSDFNVLDICCKGRYLSMPWKLPSGNIFFYIRPVPVWISVMEELYLYISFTPVMLLFYLLNENSLIINWMMCRLYLEANF